MRPLEVYVWAIVVFPFTVILHNVGLSLYQCHHLTLLHICNSWWLFLSLMMSHDKLSSLTPWTWGVWGCIISGPGPTAWASAAHSRFHGAFRRWPREQCGVLCWFWGPCEPNFHHLLAALLAWPRAPRPFPPLWKTLNLAFDFYFYTWYNPWGKDMFKESWR